VEERYIHPFASDLSFLDPQIFSDPSYGPKRYKEIVKECWYISDNTSTSYTDVLDLSFQERFYLIEYINEKQEATKKAIEESRQKSMNKNK
jgi:hypothetical protein